MPLFVVNSTTDTEGRRVPDLADASISWVGHIYQKTGNVFKYLLFTQENIAGDPGVFGPIPDSAIQDALDADGIQEYRGFKVDEVPDWAVSGFRVADAPVKVGRITETDTLIGIEVVQ